MLGLGVGGPSQDEGFQLCNTVNDWITLLSFVCLRRGLCKFVFSMLISRKKTNYLSLYRVPVCYYLFLSCWKKTMHRNDLSQTGEMAQQVRALGTLPGDQSLIPSTHIGRLQLVTQVPEAQTASLAWEHLHSYTQTPTQDVHIYTEFLKSLLFFF